MYLIGVIPPVLLHVALSIPITGDGRLGLAPLPARTVRIVAPDAQVKPADSDEDLLTAPPTIVQRISDFSARLTGAFLGQHGLLTHFPVLLIGIAGIATVCHRHWPWTTKTLAIITVAGSVIIIVRYVWLPVDWKWAMFAVRWYVVFLPMFLFWAGAWLRRRHHPAVWATAGVLLAFSVIVSLIGATDPMPREGYDRYTPAAALRTLTHPAGMAELSQLAGR
jgi:hypothetical protein